MAFRELLALPEGAREGRPGLGGGPGGRREAVREVHGQAGGEAPGPAGGRQAPLHGQRGGRPRAGLVGGCGRWAAGRRARSADVPASRVRTPTTLPAGRARAPTRRRGPSKIFIWAARGPRPTRKTRRILDGGPGRRIEMRWARRHIAGLPRRAKSPRILACQASVD